MTGNDVLAAMRAAAQDRNHPGHLHARRIVVREHFKVLYAPTLDDLHRNDAGALQLFEAASERFGDEHVRFDRYTKGAGSAEFPVLRGGPAQEANLESLLEPRVEENDDLSEGREAP